MMGRERGLLLSAAVWRVHAVGLRFVQDESLGNTQEDRRVRAGLATERRWKRAAVADQSGKTIHSAWVR
jgi:hypothetical protein